MVRSRLFSFLISTFIGVSIIPVVSADFTFGDAGTVIRMESLVKSVEVRESRVSVEDEQHETHHHEETPTLPVASGMDMYAPLDSELAQVLSTFVYMDTDAELLMTAAEREQKKRVVINTLLQFPTAYYSSLEKIELKGASQKSRGLANKRMIILQIGQLSDDEVAAVLVHELAHVVDGGFLEGNSLKESAFRDGKQMVAEDDLSAQFYAISWTNEISKKNDQNSSSFVSGYAESNPYEDFAETFAYYVLQGDVFRTRAQNNNDLQKKYEFMQFSVFSGKEFGKKSNVSLSKIQPWDVTKLSYRFSEVFTG